MNMLNNWVTFWIASAQIGLSFFIGRTSSTGDVSCGPFLCRNWGHCVDHVTGQCKCAVGFKGQECTAKIECAPLGLLVKNAIIRPTPYDAVPAPFGMMLNYQCFSDFRFEDDPNRDINYHKYTRCNASGVWKPDPVPCVAVCPPIPTWRGYIVDSKSRIEGTIITYQCYGVYPPWQVHVDWVGKRQYQFAKDVPNPDGDQITTCTANGTWHPPLYDCEEVSGGAPPFANSALGKMFIISLTWSLSSF